MTTKPKPTLFEKYIAARDKLHKLEDEIEALVEKLCKCECMSFACCGATSDASDTILVVHYLSIDSESAAKLDVLEDRIYRATGFEHVEFYPLPKQGE